MSLRDRWREFIAAYPRFGFFLAFLVAVTIIVNLVLLAVLLLYSYELHQMRFLMTKAEHKRIEALSTTQQNRLSLAVEMTRRSDQGDKDLHLTVNTQKGLMILAREGAQLREMKIQAGHETTVGNEPDRVRLVLPLGKRLVVDVVDKTYPFMVPDWAYESQGLKPPSSNIVPGALGSLAIFLDSGTILYAASDKGPLSAPDYVLPGCIRMATADVEAIRKAIRPGMVVYFY